MMSISASIDIKIALPDRVTASKIIIIQKLLDFGWTFNDYGKVSYLPIGDEGNFNWHIDNISVEKLMMILKEKEKRNEIIGIVMTWKETDIGGNVLLIKNGGISLCLTINRRVLVDSSITDINWYLVRILPAFCQDDLIVESFSYKECL